MEEQLGVQSVFFRLLSYVGYRMKKRRKQFFDGERAKPLRLSAGFFHTVSPKLSRAIHISLLQCFSPYPCVLFKNSILFASWNDCFMLAISVWLHLPLVRL